MPHLINLNEDPMLTGKITYSLTNEETHVGRKNGDPQPEIILNGMGIEPNHAIINNDHGTLYVTPFSVRKILIFNLHQLEKLFRVYISKW